MINLTSDLNSIILFHRESSIITNTLIDIINELNKEKQEIEKTSILDSEGTLKSLNAKIAKYTEALNKHQNTCDKIRKLAARSKQIQKAREENLSDNFKTSLNISPTENKDNEGWLNCPEERLYSEYLLQVRPKYTYNYKTCLAHANFGIAVAQSALGFFFLHINDLPRARLYLSLAGAHNCQKDFCKDANAALKTLQTIKTPLNSIMETSS